MNQPTRLPQWNAPVIGLVLLSAIPFLGGMARVLGLAGLFPQEGDGRFAADPLPSLVHIIGGTSFATFGALQFLPSLRRGAWHRVVGRVLSMLGVGAALAGTWMAWAWPAKEFDSLALNLTRTTFALAMVVFIVKGVTAARRRELVTHQVWMTRAYALWAAGGTQAFTLLPFIVPGFEHLQSPALYALLAGLSWPINLAIAEWSLKSTSSVSPRVVPAQQVAS